MFVRLGLNSLPETNAVFSKVCKLLTKIFIVDSSELNNNSWTKKSVFKVNKNILRFFLAATCCLNVFGTIPDLSIWFSLSISSIDFACEMASLNKVKIYECVRKLVLILS